MQLRQLGRQIDELSERGALGGDLRQEAITLLGKLAGSEERGESPDNYDALREPGMAYLPMAGGTKRQALLERIFGNLADGRMVLDNNGSVAYVNRAMEEILGASKGQLTGRNFQALAWNEVALRIVEVFESVINDGVGKRFEVDVKAATGQGRCYAFTADKVDDGVFIQHMDVTALKNERLKFQEGELEYKRVVDNLGDGLFTDDVDGRILFVNNRFLEIFGLQRQDLEGKTWKDFVAPEYLEYMKDRHSKRLAGIEVPSNYEFLGLRKDGTKRWMEIRVAPVVVDGRVQGTQSVLRDVTEKKEAELALRQSERKFIHALDNMSEGAQLIGFEQRYIYVNAEFQRMAKYTGEELRGAKVFERFPQSVDTEFAFALNKCLTERVSFRTESEFQLRDGALIWLDMNVIAVPEGAFVLTTDITEKKLSEQLLKVNEKHFEEIGTSLLGVILQFRIDENGNKWFSYVSNGCADFLGASAEEIYSDPRAALRDVHPDDVAFIYDYLYKVNGDAQKGNIVFRVKGRKERQYRWVKASASTKTVGRSMYINAYLVDVTEIKRAEQLLEIRNKELKKTNEELDKFVYSTSHDLRGPLLSLLGLIELSEQAIVDINELTVYFKMMKSGIARIDDIIKEILNYSKNARMDMRPERLDVRGKIEKAVSDSVYLNPELAKAFTINISDAIPFYSDGFRVSGIINNLVSNAVKYLKTDEASPMVRISFYTTSNEGILEIEDNGEGIAEDKQEKVFEMFYRNSSKSVGPGLGLYICREMVNKLSGSIILKSKPGRGSVFKVILPNCRETQPAVFSDSGIKGNLN